MNVVWFRQRSRRRLQRAPINWLAEQMDINDGDNFLSLQDRHIWELIYSTLERFGCLTIFRKRGPYAPGRKDCEIIFFVPRGHPRAEEVKAYLEHESKPLMFVARQLNDDFYYPNTHVRVLMFAGINYHIDRDRTEEMSQQWAEAFMASLCELPQKKPAAN